ncbi:MAG: PEP-CTERM sorting domain-containing protein [Kiritimatiellia bacterium]
MKFSRCLFSFSVGIGLLILPFPVGLRAEIVYAVSFTTGELIQYDTNSPASSRTTVLSGGSLVSPASLALGPDGNLYIGENGDGSTFAPRISKYEVDTLTLSTVYAFSSFEIFPASLVFQGNDLLVGRNSFYSNTGAVVKLENATGGILSISDYSVGGALSSSPGLALGSDGKLYVADQSYAFGTGIASGSVKRFNAAGAYIDELIGDGASNLAGPTGLVINGNTLYTASVMNGEILETDLTTDVTSSFASTGSPFEAGPMALVSDGSLLVGSVSGTGSIYHFNSDGSLRASFASGLGQIGGVVSGTVIPEPDTVVLLLLGTLLGWRGFCRRKQI